MGSVQRPDSVSDALLPTLVVPVEPVPAAQVGGQMHRGWPLFRLAFRPFYLGAALFSVLAVPLWVVIFLGRVSLDLAVPPLLWHAHEMLFGFACAVIIGFLLTAGKVWTGLGTPRGAFLGTLALLWASARVAGIVGSYPVYALLDLALLPLVAAVMFDRLVRARNLRNLPLAGVLVLLTVVNAAFHLAMVGIIGIEPMSALHAGLGLIVTIECVIAGRVVPGFTMSATPGLKLVVHPAIERATLASSAVALLLWVFAPPGGVWGQVSACACAIAAALHLARQWRWQPGRARGRPILWILHAAYAWMAIGFGLLALAQLGLLAASLGAHALAVGATGGLIIGMMTRTARGHTGRPIHASKAEVVAYGLILAAASIRVVGPLAAPQWLPQLLVGAALAWCAAFVIYLVVFGPWLVKARLDGMDG